MTPDLSEELAIYSRAIPKQVYVDVHRWDETPWLTRWKEPMTKDVAHFWFIAATMPERLVDLSRLKHTPKLLKHTARPGDLTREVAISRLKAWQREFVKHYKSDRFFTQIPIVGLLRHFFDLSTSFVIVRESFDSKWWPATVQFLGQPASESDRETLRQWLILKNFGRAERLLRANLVSVVGTSADALEILLEDFEAKRTPGATSIALAEALNGSDWIKWAKAIIPELDQALVGQVFRKLEGDAAPYLTSRILSANRRIDFLPLIDGLKELEDPRAVQPLLALYGRPETSRAAEGVLKLNAAWVVQGLEGAKEIRGKIGKAAAALAPQPKNRQTSAANLSPLEATDYPVWLKTFASSEKPTGLPQYASLKRLPVLHTSGHAATVGKDIVYGLLQKLQKVTPDSSPDWAQRAQDFFEFESLREFLWTLFHEFSRHGVKTEHLWIIDAIGVFGDDELVFRVMPYAEDWAIAGHYTAAERLVGAIARLNTETSLTTLSRYATSSRVKFIRTTAGRFLASEAAKRGLSPEDLEDRSIDDAGLFDGQTFDYGERSFTLGLGPNFKVVAIDATGQKTPGLPRARKSDDPEMVQRAKQEFSLTRQRVNQVVVTQKARLEQAMVNGRRWHLDRWRSTFITHPIMRFLAVRVVWAAFDHDGKVRFTFRVTDELTLSSIHDTDVVAADILHIGVVHPLEIPPESRLNWQERLAEYEIVTPFEQMTRPIFARPEDLTLSFASHAIESGWLRGHFASRGWQVQVRDGLINEYWKSFVNTGVQASIRIFPGIQFSGGPKHKQLIRHLRFVVEDLGSADIVSVSEVLYDVYSLVDRNLTK